MGILKLNVAAHPKSANAFDSLADAYLAAGEKEQARASAQKALELVGSDTVDPEAKRKAIHDNAERTLQKVSAGQ